MATLFRRGKTWWIDTGTNGKRLRWSLKTTDERVARRKLKKYEYEQATGDLELPSLTPIDSFLQFFCEHLETIRSRKAYKNDVSYLRTFFGPVCEALKPGSTLNHRHEARKPIKVRFVALAQVFGCQQLERLLDVGLAAWVIHSVRARCQPCY